MPGWAVLVIVVASQAISVLIVWLLVKRAFGVPSYTEIVEKIAVKSANDRLEAEKSARAAVETANKDLAEQAKAIHMWYQERKDRIKKDAQKEYEELVGDPAALDAKLDELIRRRREDPTQKG